MIILGNNKNVEFKYATREDVSKILFFINQIAIYEKMEDDVVATEEILLEWIFDKKMAEVVFAVVDGKEVGFILFFHNFSTFLGKGGIHLEDFFVLEEERGKGYGKALFKKMGEIAVERKCGRLEWTCLKWNKPSIDFYLSFGAEVMSEWDVYRLSGKTLEEMPK